MKSGENKAVWLDGEKVLDGTVALPFVADFYQLAMGGSGPQAGLVNGLIDDFAVYGAERPDEAIANLAAGMAADGFTGDPPVTTPRARDQRYRRIIW